MQLAATDLALYTVLGLLAGTLGGWLGIGGGALMVPMLILVAKMEQRLAIVTSLAVIIPIAVAGSIRHYLLRQVDWTMVWPKFWPMAVGGVVGGLIGAWLLREADPKWTARALSVLWVYSAVRLWMTTMPAR